MSLIQKCGSGIAHCPLSNQYFAGRVLPLRDALNLNVHVGLGTDISGGTSASQFESCRLAISASRMLESCVVASITANQHGIPDIRINYIEAFLMAIAGGGIVLDEPNRLFRRVSI